MLHDGAQAIVVDPGDARPVMDALDARSLELVGILVTHHHPDHTAGLGALRSRLGTLRGHCIYGPAYGDIEHVQTRLSDGDQLELLGLSWEVLYLPGHTLDHIGFFTPAAGHGEPGVLFCGDTLFSGGCGRLFEGTAVQLYRSLQRLTRLPSLTQVCCTHEYTLANLKFAMTVEPDNARLRDYFQHCMSLRQHDRPTLPSTLALELQVNPFLRCDQPTVVASALQHRASAADPRSIFTTLRDWKNNFH